MMPEGTDRVSEIGRADAPKSHRAAPPIVRPMTSRRPEYSTPLGHIVAAQDPAYPAVLAELRNGHKVSHWMWFIFPQLAGLGHSEMSRRYSLPSAQGARDYLAHPVLGPRLMECAGIVLATSGRTAAEIFGHIDARKLRSCITLFHRAAPGERLFVEVLDRYFGGEVDPATDALLGHDGQADA